MSKSIISYAIFGTIALGILIIVLYLVSVYNRAVTLHTQYDAKVEANKTELANVKAKISQTVQVTDLQMESLTNLYKEYADARTPENAGKLMSWIQEAAPNVDQSTFHNLQNIIVGSRDSWTFRQQELVDISREYNEMLVRFPSNFFLGMFGFEKIKPQIVTSTETEEAFESGVDDNLKLK